MPEVGDAEACRAFDVDEGQPAGHDEALDGPDRDTESPGGLPLVTSSRSVTLGEWPASPSSSNGVARPRS